MISKEIKLLVSDIDGTLFRSALLVESVKQLVKNGVFPVGTEKEYKHQYRAWRNREDGGEYADYINGVVSAYLINIKGVRQTDVEEAARQVVEKYWRRVYRYTRDLIERKRAEGYFLIFISHSPQEIVAEFARRYQFDAWQGTVYEVDENGLYTGRLAPTNNFDKSAVLSRIIAENNLRIPASIAVGDSEADIGMLGMVRDPRCFNPNKLLRAKAREQRWLTVLERKDLIIGIRGNVVVMEL